MLTRFGKFWTLARLGLDKNIVKNNWLETLTFNKSFRFKQIFQKALKEIETKYNLKIETKNIVKIEMTFRYLQDGEKTFDELMIVGWYENSDFSWIIFINTTTGEIKFFNDFEFKNPHRENLNEKIKFWKIYDIKQSFITGNFDAIMLTVEKDTNPYNDINSAPDHSWKFLKLDGAIDNQDDGKYITLVTFTNPNNYIPGFKKRNMELNKIIELTKTNNDLLRYEMKIACHRLWEIKENYYFIALKRKSKKVYYESTDVFKVKFSHKINETELGYEVPRDAVFRGKKQHGTFLNINDKVSKKVSADASIVNPLTTFDIRCFDVDSPCEGFVYLGKQINDFKDYYWPTVDYEFKNGVKYMLSGESSHLAGPAANQLETKFTKNSLIPFIKYPSLYGFQNYQDNTWIDNNFVVETVNLKIDLYKYQLKNILTGTINSEIYWTEKEAQDAANKLSPNRTIYQIIKTFYKTETFNETVKAFITNLHYVEFTNVFEIVVPLTKEQFDAHQKVIFNFDVKNDSNKYGESTKAVDMWINGFGFFRGLTNRDKYGNETKNFKIECDLTNPARQQQFLFENINKDSYFYQGHIHLPLNMTNKPPASVAAIKNIFKKTMDKFNKERYRAQVVWNYNEGHQKLYISVWIWTKIIINCIYQTNNMHFWDYKTKQFKREEVQMYQFYGARWVDYFYNLKEIYWEAPKATTYVKTLFKNDAEGANSKMPVVEKIPNLDITVFPDFTLTPIFPEKHNSVITVLQKIKNHIHAKHFSLEKKANDSKLRSVWKTKFDFQLQNLDNIFDAQFFGNNDFNFLILGFIKDSDNGNFISISKDGDYIYFSEGFKFNSPIFLATNYARKHIIVSVFSTNNKLYVYDNLINTNEIGLKFKPVFDSKLGVLPKRASLDNDLFFNSGVKISVNIERDLAFETHIDFENYFILDYSKIQILRLYNNLGIDMFEKNLNFNKREFNKLKINYDFALKIVSSNNFDFINKEILEKYLYNKMIADRNWDNVNFYINNILCQNIKLNDNVLILKWNKGSFKKDDDIVFKIDTYDVFHFKFNGKNEIVLKIYWGENDKGKI